MAAKVKNQSKPRISEAAAAEDPVETRLDAQDQEIVDALVYVVSPPEDPRLPRLPRHLRHVWREPYNEIALLLRDKVRISKTDLADKAAVYRIVSDWVAEERVRPKGPRARG